MKKPLAFLLALILLLACLPLGAVPAFAAEVDETQPPTDADPEATEEPTVPETAEETASPETAPPVSTETSPTENDALVEGEMESVEIPMLFSTNEVMPLADINGGSSGSEIGDGGGGGGNTAGDGSSNMVAAGVTMQIVYYRYDQCYNRYNSHGNVINTVKNGKAIPWNSTGKDKGETMTTVFDTFTITPNTFVVKARWDSYPYVYHFPYENLSDDKCTFKWTGFTSYWFNYENPGGKADTYPRIVRNETNGSKAHFFLLWNLSHA